MVSGRSDANTGRIRLGMVGGGQGAFIGAVHRLAARMDDQYEFVAGALSADAKKAKASGAELGLIPERIYTDFREMAKAESKRADGIEAPALSSSQAGSYPAITPIRQSIRAVWQESTSPIPARTRAGGADEKIA